ncbi:putative 2-hydroxychromene-2-carboxylate isomerase [Aspergillus campestris IBT 28561]|uniref:Glutathione S-transferase kappa n=1 Tax=Aspergillus campestris (strain IBT 28561) TaxID=1392248 RepID=A0A2I1CWU5_ASPC2|nr:putative 2-hydroxychromene-2-carboxylate isomerase [Aspergillus campestris IBT 28561]PKY02099.1 putative 2-hydroxychromene-2-carboxylate isomerase [Aspergillus campestris IBT 28561]
MAPPQIKLYLDIVSPFGYIAFHILQNSPVFASCNVTYVPIFLGGLMKACGNTPPIRVKNKDIWINEERRRWARYFSIPMVHDSPEGFPPMTLAPQRALCAISQKKPDQLAPAIGALYHSFWTEGNAKIGQVEGFQPVLEKVLGKDGTQEILAAANEEETKSRLSALTDQAFQSGAFGLPWFECTNSQGQTEGFWGIDHLGQVTDFLGLNRATDKGFRSLL